MQDKQRKFALEYIKDRNATQAAIRAGYSKKTAGVQGARLLRNASVRKIVDKAAEIEERDAIATLAECCERLTERIRDEDASTIELNTSIKTLAELKGYKAPEKQEVAVDHSVQVEFVN